MKEDLLRAGLPARTLDDLDLALPHEVAVLHDVIERFDLERRVEQATLFRRIERDAVMQPVDPEVGDIADPVAEFGPEFLPELEIPLQVGRLHADAVELGDAGVTAGKITAAALGRARDQIDAVAGAIPSQQRGLNIATLAVAGRRAAGNKAASAQPPLDFIERGLVPDFDPDARAAARTIAEAHRAKAVIRTESNLAILLRHALQAEDIGRKPRTGLQLARREPDIANRHNERLAVRIHGLPRRTLDRGCRSLRKTLII